MQQYTKKTLFQNFFNSKLQNFLKHILCTILHKTYQFILCKFSVVAFTLYLVVFLLQSFGNILASVAVLLMARVRRFARYNGLNARR